MHCWCYMAIGSGLLHCMLLLLLLLLRLLLLCCNLLLVLCCILLLLLLLLLLWRLWRCMLLLLMCILLLVLWWWWWERSRWGWGCLQCWLSWGVAETCQHLRPLKHCHQSLHPSLLQCWLKSAHCTGKRIINYRVSGCCRSGSAPRRAWLNV